MQAQNVPARQLVAAGHGEESLPLQDAVPRLHGGPGLDGDGALAGLDLRPQLPARPPVRVLVRRLALALVRGEDASVPAGRRGDVQVELDAVAEREAVAVAPAHEDGGVADGGVLGEVQLQLLVPEAEEGAAGDDLGVAVVERAALVAEVLAVNALGARGHADGPGLRAHAGGHQVLAESHHDARQHLQDRREGTFSSAASLTRRRRRRRRRGGGGGEEEEKKKKRRRRKRRRRRRRRRIRRRRRRRIRRRRRRI